MDLLFPVIITVDTEASGYYFDDAIIRDLKHRLQDYVHLATLRKILTTGGARLDGKVEGVLQGVVADDYGNQIIVRVNFVVVPWIGRNLFSMTTAAKKGMWPSSTTKIQHWKESTSPYSYGARAATPSCPCWT